MTVSIFTDLITSANVTALITNLAIVFGGIIGIMLILSPAFLAKGGLEYVLQKVSSLFGGRAV